MMNPDKNPIGNYDDGKGPEKKSNNIEIEDYSDAHLLAAKEQIEKQILQYRDMVEEIEDKVEKEGLDRGDKKNRMTLNGKIAHLKELAIKINQECKDRDLVQEIVDLDDDDELE